MHPLELQLFPIDIAQLDLVSDGASHTGTGSCILHNPLYSKPFADGKIVYSNETSCVDSGTGWGSHSKANSYESPAFSCSHFRKGTGNCEYNFFWLIDKVSIVLGGDEGLAPPGYPWHYTAKGDVLLFVRVYKKASGRETLTQHKEISVIAREYSDDKLNQKHWSIMNQTMGIGVEFFANQEETMLVKSGIRIRHQLDLDGCHGYSRISVNSKLTRAEWSPILG